MYLQLNKILAILIAVLGFGTANAQNGAITGFCTSGSTQAVVSGLKSTNTLQGIIPKCTVSVYFTGTTTLAPIYSSIGGTTLANPFTANQLSGQWLFYALASANYDIVLSGGTPPNVYATPLTLTGVGAGGGGGGESGVTQIIAGTNVSLSPSGGTGAVTISAAGSSGIGPLVQADAFGDSITYAFESTGANLSGWVKWLTDAIYVPTPNVLNTGVPGNTCNTNDALVMTTPFSYAVSQLLSELIGTNNVAGGDVSTLKNQYGSCLSAHILHWLVPPSQQFNFSSSAFTVTSGTAANGGYVGKVFTTPGTGTFSVTGNNLHVVTHAQNSSTAAGTVTCAGNSALTLNFLSYAGAGGGGLQDNYILLTGSSPHTCAVSITSAGSGTTAQAGLEFYAGLNGASITAAPLLLEGQIPDENPINSVTAAYRTVQAAAVTALQSQGLSTLNYVITAGAVPPSEYNDNLHFTNLGYHDFAIPWIAAVNTAETTSFTIAPFTKGGNTGASPITDQCSGLAKDTFCIGYGAGLAQITGAFSNSIAGIFAAHNLTTSNNVSVYGWSSLSGCTTGCSGSTAMGAFVLSASNGGLNSGLGYGSLAHLTTGHDMLGLGVFGCINATTSFLGICGGNNSGLSDGLTSVDVTTDSNFTLMGHSSGKSTASILSGDWGAYGGSVGCTSLVAVDFAYEIGCGINQVAHSLAYRGKSFVKDDGSLIGTTVVSNQGGQITSITPQTLVGSGYTVSDVLPVVQAGSSGTGTLTVTSIGTFPQFVSTAQGSNYQGATQASYTTACVSGACTGSGFTFTLAAWNMGAVGTCAPSFNALAYNILSFGTGYIADGSIYQAVASSATPSATGSGCLISVTGQRTGVPTAYTISNAGQVYNLGKNVNLSGGTGTGAQANIIGVLPSAGSFCFGATSGVCATDIGDGKGPRVNAPFTATSLGTSVYTVATLPSASSLPAGKQVVVSDATTFTPGTCTGGGSDYMIAVTNGTTWSCH